MKGDSMELSRILLIFVSLILLSCGSDDKSDAIDDLKKAVETVQNIPETAEKIENSMTRAEKKWEERKARGDTLALHYKELQKFLPETIPGYVTQKTKGHSNNYMGQSISQASRRYFKKTDGQPEILNIEIIDYNSSLAGFAASTSWLVTDYSYEDDNKYIGNFDVGIDECFGNETFEKKNKKAQLILSAGYRFIINISANNQESIDKLKSILKYIDLKQLASL